MSLLQLPDEILLEVFKKGGPEVFAGGAAESCRRLRLLSFDGSLWGSWLAPLFRKRCLTPVQIAAIGDYRTWYMHQQEITRHVMQAVDAMIAELHAEHDTAPSLIEAWATRILRHRLSCLDALDLIKQKPRTLAHYHWAHWLTEVAYRLEGLRILLGLTCENNWGNGAVEVPMDHVMALLMLRLGRNPFRYLDAISNGPPSLGNSSEPMITQVESLIAYVERLSAHLPHKRDFLSTLSRSCLFVCLGRQLGWNTRLLTSPMASYCTIEEENGKPPLFVDFSRDGKLRTADEIRQRLMYTRTSPDSVQYGISLYDILATAYVWHSMRTSNRHSVLELVEHAAHDVKVTPLKQHPLLYGNLVTRIIERNIAEVDAPIPRSRANSVTSTSASLSVGKVCQLVGGTPDGPKCGVILERDGDSCLVLRGYELVHMSKTMLIPGFDGKLTTEAGLTVPDIGADILMLGQYFVEYDRSQQQFLRCA